MPASAGACADASGSLQGLELLDRGLRHDPIRADLLRSQDTASRESAKARRRDAATLGGLAQREHAPAAGFGSLARDGSPSSLRDRVADGGGDPLGGAQRALVLPDA